MDLQIEYQAAWEAPRRMVNSFNAIHGTKNKSNHTRSDETTELLQKYKQNKLTFLTFLIRDVFHLLWQAVTIRGVVHLLRW